MVTILDVGDDNGNESLTVYVVNYVDDRSATHMLCWPLTLDFIFVILNAFFHKKSWIIVLPPTCFADRSKSDFLNNPRSISCRFRYHSELEENYCIIYTASKANKYCIIFCIKGKLLSWLPCPHSRNLHSSCSSKRGQSWQSEEWAQEIQVDTSWWNFREDWEGEQLWNKTIYKQINGTDGMYIQL